MCGISGIYASNITDKHVQLIDSIIASQLTRGPDHHSKTLIKGHYNQALLGHNRLSIIDLSEEANQPMWDTTGRYCIVYNGEIYNYIEIKRELQNLGLIFKTLSDTEVILNAFSYWGIDALNHFRGPFAFAIFDRHKEELWLCRDRFGVRPLFYTIRNNVLYFASSTQVLAKHLNLKPNLHYLAQGLKYLVYENGGDSSAYHNLNSIASGHYLHAKLNEPDKLIYEIKSYYDLTTNVENTIEKLSVQNTDELLNRLYATLNHSVEIRLRSDVPLAISLSSGLDSSSIAALVKRQHQNTIGFSFGHPDLKKTEGPLVSTYAKYLKMPIEYVWPTSNEMIDALHTTIQNQDAPFSTFSIVAQHLLYKKVRSFGIKVLLGGQGGDESFMGYKKFFLFLLQQNIKKKNIVATAINIWQAFFMLTAELSSLNAYWKHRHRFIAGSKKMTASLNLPESPIHHLGISNQPLWQRQMLDIMQFSLPTLLRYEDRNAMGNSVESRLPYLDHELVELGLALPESLKLRSGYGKWAIRKIMEDKIPNTIRLARYKRGFDVQLNSFVHAGLGSHIRSSLSDHRTIVKEFLKNENNINEIFSDQQLINRKNAVTESITLLWLAKVLT